MPNLPLPLTDLDLAARLLQPADLAELGDLIAQASRARQAASGHGVEFCAIVNARSGRCSEDCAFCAQSAHHQTTAEIYPLLPAAEIVARARAAAAAGAMRFGIVTSGRGCPSGRAFGEICRAIEQIRAEGLISPCASLGLLTPDQAQGLAAAGLTRYHHNLEAGPSYFPRICTSHAFADRVDTVRAAQAAGLEVCVGGIVGLGETPRQRAELALATAALNPESVPLNFLNPIPGTRLGHLRPLTPLEALAAVAVFRLMLPSARIRTCGGRQQVLGNLAPLMYLAGADATMIGNYLTTEGRQPADDINDLAALGLSALGREG
ncbi:MAG: biotin synthase BioB [Pseudomonadota bacterium]